MSNNITRVDPLTQEEWRALLIAELTDRGAVVHRLEVRDGAVIVSFDAAYHRIVSEPVHPGDTASAMVDRLWPQVVQATGARMEGDR